jgi:hypothetical protein
MKLQRDREQAAETVSVALRKLAVGSLRDEH